MGIALYLISKASHDFLQSACCIWGLFDAAGSAMAESGFTRTKNLANIDDEYADEFETREPVFGVVACYSPAGFAAGKTALCMGATVACG